ncbi:hypothetical protein KUTeg_000659 [Tegillarca granosa]|uniref:Uncharacterized protein n=1 Tax=Tegillarca granosa TaxID=220873 RepID=A0ABQ9FY56_TEGGR|nr:hypothetical protein KUTeg_000659 [Tegillarca granosa]
MDVILPLKMVQKLEKEMSALKEEGNKAYKEQNYKKALESYTHALDLLLNNFQDFSKEAAILYSNRSMVYSGQNKNELALADAVDSVRICPSWNKGHWRRGQVLRSMGQHREAYSAFLEGFHKSEDISQDVKCNFLTEAAISFSNISEEVLMQRCYKGFEGVPIEFWSTVLGNLSKKGEWIAIRYLVLGMTDTDIGVARYANSIEVDFSKLFPFLYKEKPSAYTHMWLTDLVAILLHNGNTLLNFKEDDKDTPVHTAVKFSLLTGSTKILDDMPNVGGMNMIDKHGDSPFHVITKRRPTSDVKSMMRVAGVLIQKGFSLDILDRDRMLAVQYINPTGQFKQLYEMLIKVTKPPPMNFPGFPSAKFSVYPTENVGIQQLKEQGNKEFQNENWQRAAEFYTLAIDVGLRMRKGGHELAVLYSNRANCNLKLGLNTQALDDAVESVSH